MNRTYLSFLIIALLFLVSCVSKKKFTAVQTELNLCNEQLGKCGESLNDYMNRLQTADADRAAIRAELSTRGEQVNDLRTQLEDCKQQRDKQMTQVGDLTVMSKGATDNMKETLEQLRKKDQYIHLLQAAKSTADSINLALAVNLKGQLAQGIEDKDVEIKVDKTVVMINLSDKMLYQSGSANLTTRANEVLSKIATIVNQRPDMEVMVEGYTDNVPISSECIKDNWDLSVKRATAVVRVLQTKYNIDPNRLIAAGRGEFNTLASNSTSEGRSTNRRTRIIILPKLNQFYDLLDPSKAPKE
ncbi:MAG: flagellar motor protein MotB [Bacteroidota bacterium]|nr:flagellar motor protein MotB [Bacteroidota bacterium]